MPGVVGAGGRCGLEAAGEDVTGVLHGDVEAPGVG